MGDVDVNVTTDLEKYTSDGDEIKSYVKPKESSNYAADLKKNEDETVKL